MSVFDPRISAQNERKKLNGLMHLKLKLNRVSRHLINLQLPTRSQKTAVDDRRHGVAHFSNWISDRDLVEQTREKCPPDTPIPSLALVRLQFTPKNKYTRRAAQYTGRFDVQRKIQVKHYFKFNVEI